MQRALGRHPEDEAADNTHQLSRYLSGQVCLCFSNMNMKELETKFKEYEEEDFAQAGAPATYTVFLQKGTEALEGFGHGMETQFRTLGLPTKLNF